MDKLGLVPTVGEIKTLYSNVTTCTKKFPVFGLCFFFIVFQRSILNLRISLIFLTSV